jgi:hypothetical protein
MNNNIQFNNSSSRGSFIIYDANVLSAKDKNTVKKYELLAFDGFINLSYENDVIIPREGLENRQFTDDSILENPFRFSLVAPISQQIDSVADLNANYENTIASQLEYIGKSNLILLIFKTAPLFRSYNNMHLKSWNYRQSVENSAMFANMRFEEIRTSYIPNQNNKQDNGLNTTNSFSATNSSNPANQKPIDNGIINTYTPDGNINNIQPSNGKVLN